MSGTLTWDVKASPGGVEFLLAGTIDESANFAGLASELGERSVLVLSGITRIKSTGVREWLNFVRNLRDAKKGVELRACSVVFVQQLNMIAGFAGAAQITSILAPYACPGCEALQERAVDLSGDPLGQINAELICIACGQGMEFDDLIENYLSFLPA